MMLREKMDRAIRNVKDFPKPGILFKDITPILKDPELCREICDAFADRWKGEQVQAVAGIEARGFLFGLMLAEALNVPFVPIRKAGKLPFTRISRTYALEYGTASIEMHADALFPGQRVLLHDDLLATGGSAAAAAALIAEGGGEVCGFAFLVDLAFLNGGQKLASFGKPVQSLVVYE